ncbi:MAG: IMS domain-containing protein [Cyanobacteria bacterium P01_D01_bin.156]
MQIPLDYYRILGLPIQATAEQLEQAHRDRILQLPRREYSDLAIQSRKQLIDIAYSALENSSQRRDYDTQLIAASGPTGSAPVTIDIYDGQVIGALLILLELGEYELVIRHGRPYLSSGSDQLQGAGEALADVVLTIGLACLELGREQWQQHQYENAAESLETGHELMVKENLFPAVQAEIQADLDKLKPYRILELVARPLNDKAARRQGIELLKAMLAQRGGIDGAYDDASGLNVEDFLRFVQQLRSYLTSAEQQEIFEVEAQRPSSVGVYLSVYALLARGFAKHQPSLVHQAKQRLSSLTERQDVYLEQAVCAVLLGQTEEATYALERSHERDPISFIRENSAGAPDLLPGLCLYTERWLQQDVFPFFRDLDQSHVTLKHYFANEQVQAYLEAMPSENSVTPGTQWGGTDYGSSTPSSYKRPSIGAAGAAFGAAGTAVAAGAATGLGAATAPPPRPRYTAEQVSDLSPEGSLGEASISSTVAFEDDTNTSPSRRRSSAPKWGRLALVFLLGLLGLGILGFIVAQLLGWLGGLFSGPQLQGDPLDVDVSRPAIELPEESTQPLPTGIQEIAETTIQSWYQAKSEAMGPQWNADALSEILLEPALAEWIGRVEKNQADGVHVEYQQTIQNLTAEEITEDQIKVTADVDETAEAYQFGLLSDEASYEEQLTVEYTLQKQDDKWMIESFVVQ